jgi:hypothetical protein
LVFSFLPVQHSQVITSRSKILIKNKINIKKKKSITLLLSRPQREHGNKRERHTDKLEEQKEKIREKP